VYAHSNSLSRLFVFTQGATLQTEIDTHLHVLHINLNRNYASATSSSAALSIMRSIFARPSGWHYSSSFGIKPDLHHALLSAKLGGGIAYMGVICDSDYGFGLSGILSGSYRSMSNDVVWDMMVVRNQLRQYHITKRMHLMCLIKQLTVSSIIDPISVQFTHELGHNVNSGHTHDGGYSPRIDTCGCSYSGGQCTDPCSSQLPLAKSATIMSYCHLCSSGYQNLDYTFGSKYVSGSRSNKNSYSNSTLLGTVSTEPRQVNARMYTHVSTCGTCTQPNNTGVSIVLNTINLFSCLPSLKFTLSFAIQPPTMLKPALSAPPTRSPTARPLTNKPTKKPTQGPTNSPTITWPSTKKPTNTS
jgi:hypothetical protein